MKFVGVGGKEFLSTMHIFVLARWFAATVRLIGKVVGVGPGTHQIGHLAAELRRIRNLGFQHPDTFRKSVRGVHQSGSIAIPGNLTRG